MSLIQSDQSSDQSSARPVWSGPGWHGSPTWSWPALSVRPGPSQSVVVLAGMVLVSLGQSGPGPGLSLSGLVAVVTWSEPCLCAGLRFVVDLVTMLLDFVEMLEEKLEVLRCSPAAKERLSHLVSHMRSL